MSCPRCGDVCRCGGDSLEAALPSTRPRLELEAAPETASPGCPTVLIDPEAYEDSEEQFSASLDTPAASSRIRFIVDSVAKPVSQLIVEEPLPEHPRPEVGWANPEQAFSPPATVHLADTPELTGPSPEVDLSFWKDEVAARVSSYRAKRKPRPPRYASLRLKFDPPPARREEPVGSSPETVVLENPVPVLGEAAMQIECPEAAVPAHDLPGEPSRIIEFPRIYPPETFDHVLAEPVLSRPRILDVPEVATAAPALGGIILEHEEKEPAQGFDTPLQAAAVRRRALAATADTLIVLTAGALFGYLFYRITSTIPTPTQLLGIALGSVLAFWVGYQYLALVHCGTTPGLRLARLRLTRFDGKPADRSLRRWRVAAAALSGISLGLGFAWCFLDPDALCWHDRITGTCLAPMDREKSSQTDVQHGSPVPSSVLSS